ncbi:MAG: hypothetical protein MZV70_07475 [Desulfobacterales bacterium]|nr:hypothetical protein [Desulfobacterales bacterium]
MSGERSGPIENRGSVRHPSRARSPGRGPARDFRGLPGHRQGLAARGCSAPSGRIPGVSVREVLPAQLTSMAGTESHQGVAARVSAFACEDLADVWPPAGGTGPELLPGAGQHPGPPQSRRAAADRPVRRGSGGHRAEGSLRAADTGGLPGFRRGARAHPSRAGDEPGAQPRARQGPRPLGGRPRARRRGPPCSARTGRCPWCWWSEGKARACGRSSRKPAICSVSIPQAGPLDSLNASVAAAVTLYEIFRTAAGRGPAAIKRRAAGWPRVAIGWASWRGGPPRPGRPAARLFFQRGAWNAGSSWPPRPATCCPPPRRRTALRLLGPHFCPGCLQGVLRVGHPLCPGCGVMFKGGVGEDHVCGRCLATPPPFHMARAAFVYDRSLVDVIHCFKYKGKTQLARPLGLLLFEAFERYWGRAPVDVVLPVPLHRRRLRERGFNQALLLVRRWPLRPGMPKVPVDTDVLRRARATAPQAGLGRRGRQAISPVRLRCGTPSGLRAGTSCWWTTSSPPGRPPGSAPDCCWTTVPPGWMCWRWRG